MQTTWIVSANAGRARFFSDADPAQPLEEIEDMINSAVRLRTDETESDRLGPTAAAKSSHNVGAATPNKTYQPAHTPAEQEAEQFAKNISDFLLQAHQQGKFKQLALVASPQFLGSLRSFLNPNLKPLVTLELNKDYTSLNAQQLREQLQAHQPRPT
jgi:protein required for attachment to host cells